MDIKNYNNNTINDFVNKAQNNDLTAEEENALNDLKGQYGEDIDNLIDRFQNMNETELITEVFRIINQKKQNGTFDPNDIDKIASVISPLLDDEQRGKMEQLINLIK